MIVKSVFSEFNLVVVDCINNLLKQFSIEESFSWSIILIDSGLSDFISPKRLHKLSPKTKICLFNVNSNLQTNSEYFRRGFNGLLSTSSTSSTVEQAINSLLLDQNFFPGGVNVHKRTPLLKSPSSLSKIPITFRQQEILSLMAMGLSNKEIANHFDLTESTVKRHMSNIFKKLGAQNRVEAARIASEHGLLLN